MAPANRREDERERDKDEREEDEKERMDDRSFRLGIWSLGEKVRPILGEARGRTLTPGA